MTVTDEDDELETPRFPILMGIPVAVWMLHGLVLYFALLVSIYLLCIAKDKSGFILAPMILGTICIGGTIILRGVLNGHPTSINYLQFFSFLTSIALGLYLSETIDLTFGICEGMMFFLCGTLSYVCHDDWVRWAKVQDHSWEPTHAP